MTTNYHTDIAPGAPVNAAIVNGPLGQLDAQISQNSTDMTNLVAGVKTLVQLNFGAPVNLSIAAGAVTVTQSRHTIDTEGLAATDDLDTINGGVNGDVLRLQIVANGRIVRVRSNMGNIHLANGAHVWLTDPIQFIDLIWTGLYWIQACTPIALRQQLNSAPATAQFINLPDKTFKTNDGRNDNNQVFLHVQPRPSARGHFFEQASNATFASNGIAAGTNAGAGALSSLTDAQAADDIYTNQNIALTAGTFGGRKSTTFNLWRRRHNPYFYTKMRARTNSALVRYWVGLCQAQVTNVDVLAAGTAGFYFRYSTNVPDPAWVAICNDGAAQSAAVSTGVTFALDTTYEMEIWVDDVNGIAYFSVNGSTPVTINTNLPASSQDLGWTVSGISLGTAAKDIAIARIYGEYGL